MADIKIDIKESKLDLYNKMQEAVSKAKGSIEGNEDSGEFEIPITLGKIRGEYFIKDGFLEVNVIKKPMLVSKNMIKQALEGFLG